MNPKHVKIRTLIPAWSLLIVVFTKWRWLMTTTKQVLLSDLLSPTHDPAEHRINALLLKPVHLENNSAEDYWQETDGEFYS